MINTALKAIEEIDVILFVIDANAALSFLGKAKKIVSAKVVTREMLLAVIERIEIGKGT